MSFKNDEYRSLNHFEMTYDKWNRSDFFFLKKNNGVMHMKNLDNNEFLFHHFKL